MPTLHAPEDIISRGTGSSGGGGHLESRVELSTDREVAGLAAHYAAQVTANGWVETGAVASDDIVVRLFSLERDDDRWHGTLVVTVVTPDRRDATFRVVALTPRRYRR